MKLFDSWVSETRKLQTEVFGADYDALAANKKALVEYISWNTKAATHELVELDAETSWKPWQHDAPYANREEIIGEAVDVLHFMANILAGVGCTDAELNERYSAKMQVNRDRQANGYEVLAVGVKCTRCKRALDDVKESDKIMGMCMNCADEVFL